MTFRDLLSLSGYLRFIRGSVPSPINWITRFLRPARADAEPEPKRRFQSRHAPSNGRVVNAEFSRRRRSVGVFVLSGGQRPRIGALIAVGGDRDAIEVRGEQDPLLLHCVATAQIVEVVSSTVDDRVSLL
jgi:hypothetical protein